ncbi:twin-arginine translocase subunit TatC [Corynebacterium xerosis]|uniref:Sec-independent protein translocase protein TatC n=1 Tax=Corynebacterium xerosis TaxID=1725 RepID=A0A7X9XSA6_9CORY|nr:twin-arginine translocase subunit TatC [Corynebacterium xerosis]NMF08090.1 twin-arginine translocase subunit TatC [Corynebacterium xerosis]
MSIVEHIQELRSRLLKAIVGIFFGTIIGFIWYQYSFTLGPWKLPFGNATFGPAHFMSLGEILKEPYCQLPPEQRFGGADSTECRLLATSPFEMFLLRLKVGAIAGLVISAPFWLYQIWAYITPGLVRRERRNTLIAVTAAALLFVAGAVLAYFVVHVGLDFLLQVGINAQIPALTGERYFNFILGLIVIFGVSFELPLFIIMLNVVGVLHYETMKDKRRLIILLLFIFAAFMTPGQEPYSMVAMAVSLTILMEIAIQFARINDKRRAKSRPDWMDLDDDQSSGPIAASGGIGQLGGIDAPAPVSASGAVGGTAPVGRTAPVSGPGAVGAPSPVGTSPHPTTRPTRNSRPAPPAAPPAEVTPDLSTRSGSDFDDVL